MLKSYVIKWDLFLASIWHTRLYIVNIRTYRFNFWYEKIAGKSCVHLQWHMHDLYSIHIITKRIGKTTSYIIVANVTFIIVWTSSWAKRIRILTTLHNTLSSLFHAICRNLDTLISKPPQSLFGQWFFWPTHNFFTPLFFFYFPHLTCTGERTVSLKRLIYNCRLRNADFFVFAYKSKLR